MSPLPLVLLHGALGDVRQLQPLAKLLDDRTVISVNFPGHGTDAVHSTPFTMDDLAAAITQVMDEHQIERADMFGYSMGGYAALWLLHLQPDRVRRLFTLGTKLSWNPEIATREQANLQPEKIREKVPALMRSLAQRHGEEHWEKVVRSTAAMMQWLGSHPLKEEDFLFMTHEICLGLGDADKMVSLEETQRVLGYLNNGSLSSLAGTPHPLEQVDLTLLRDVLIRFLN